MSTTFKTIAAVKRANKAAGMHYFEASTMRFFRSQVEGELKGGRYFVTSERAGDDAPRLYSVREVHADASIDTVGEFQGYATRADANRAIRALIVANEAIR